MIKLDTEYTVTDKATKATVAVVKVVGETMHTMIRWDGHDEWVADDEALAMVLFPDEVGVTVTP